ncbi:hypothetical protein BH23GEM6_BH23GEM6_06720 [soil metagenome]
MVRVLNKDVVYFAAEISVRFFEGMALHILSHSHRLQSPVQRFFQRKKQTSDRIPSNAFREVCFRA